MAHILIAGCGSIGLKLADKLIAEGHQVTGLKRHLPGFTIPGMQFYQADICNYQDLKALSMHFDQVFFILAPDSREAASYENIYVRGLNNLLSHFEEVSNPPLWFFVSSSSVYAQSQGEWIDESSPAEPLSPTSQVIRRAEQRLWDNNSSHCVVRFSGIYGPGREALLRLAQQVPVIQQDPPYYTNRIHAEDCVNVLNFLLAQRLDGHTLANCYLASDDYPASQWEVMSWLADQMGVMAPSPKCISTPIDQNKRCRNTRLKALGFKFQYPDYQAGYGALLREREA